MIAISEPRLRELFTRMKGKRIAVVGDLMLDRYLWGSVSRISPEAPVPVVDMADEQMRLGGAANVAKNIKSLGGEPMLFGVIGNDNSGKQLLDIARGSAFALDGIVTDPSRPTTVKTRVIAHSQHVVRIDRETKTDIPQEIQARVMQKLRAEITSIDGLIIEDYNKGFVAAGLIRQIVELANQHNLIVTVDPKFKNFFEYRNVTVFKPNRNEVEEALGARLETDADVAKAGKVLLERLKARNILLTLGEKGMSLFEENGSVSSVPTKARNVADVSGAGDTVISTLTLALAAGAAIKEAAALANFAGGVVCGYVGIVPIDPDELQRVILEDLDHL